MILRKVENQTGESALTRKMRQGQGETCQGETSVLPQAADRWKLKRHGREEVAEATQYSKTKGWRASWMGAKASSPWSQLRVGEVTLT